MNGKVLNGRTINVSIAKDNGRAAEFIKRRVSVDGPLLGTSMVLSLPCPSQSSSLNRRLFSKITLRQKFGRVYIMAQMI